MKYLTLALLVFVGFASAQVPTPFAPPPPPPPVNPNIDMDGYLKSTRQAADHRATRRLTEEQFLKMSEEPGVLILDARSKEKFDLLHIKGAVNLNFSDITIESLKKTIPDKDTKILIYCNNNFKNSEVAFPSKAPVASLNISTYITLYNYGYRNIYELGPQLDPAKSKLPFVSTPKTR